MTARAQAPGHHRDGRGWHGRDADGVEQLHLWPAEAPERKCPVRHLAFAKVVLKAWVTGLKESDKAVAVGSKLRRVVERVRELARRADLEAHRPIGPRRRALMSSRDDAKCLFGNYHRYRILGLSEYLV